MIKGKRYFVSTSLNLAQQTEAHVHVIRHVHNIKWFYCFKVLCLILFRELQKSLRFLCENSADG